MNSSPSHFITPPTVLHQIAVLPSMSMAEVRSLWRELHGTDATTSNRQFLERHIAFRLQEIEFRKVDRALVDRNKRRIDALIDSGQNKKRDRDIRLRPGTLLTREYQGREYLVVTTPDGHYEFEGRPYRSLSRIAREITGTAWSGPLFFGLKASTASKQARRKGARK